ncbi:MAG: SulP family inorganic anion transporter [Methylococcaceae bacterium]
MIKKHGFYWLKVVRLGTMSKSTFNTLSSSHLGKDLLGGFTAALAALPLALAFGVASGAGPTAGMYSAILVGFFAALFGGTFNQVSGPTAPMTILMTSILVSLQTKYPETGLLLAFNAVIIAGLMQTAFGLLKLGHYFDMVPNLVIASFMSGIGIILIVLQVGPLLGQSTATSLMDSLRNIPVSSESINWSALLLGILSLCIMVFWPKDLAKWFSPYLAALLIGTVISLLWLAPASTPTIGEISTGLPDLYWPVFSMDVLSELLYTATMLALLGSIESLQTALVVENLTNKPHYANKELIGQGIGNTIAGLFGGLPGAGAAIQTTANIQAGGGSGYAGASHAVCLLLVWIIAGKYASYVPLAVLAGILIKVGFDLIEWTLFRKIKKLPLMTNILLFSVLFITLFIGLLPALLAGVFISNLITVERLASIQLTRVRLTDGDRAIDTERPYDDLRLERHHGAAVLLHLGSQLSSGQERGLKQRLRAFTSHRMIVINLTKTSLVGDSPAMILDDIIREELNQDRQVLLVGMSESVEAALSPLGAIELVGHKWIFDELGLALDQVAKTLD